MTYYMGLGVGLGLFDVAKRPSKRLMRLRLWTFFYSIVSLFWTTSCRSSEEYEWAYAENLDGTVLENEHCRQSLAEVPYLTTNKPLITQNGNRFAVQGDNESYTIIAFHTEDACNLELSNARRRK